MKERLQQLLSAMGYSATRLADEIQVQRSGISHILSGRNHPSFDFISRLLTRFQKVDARWLLTGAGEMFIRDITENRKDAGHNEIKPVINEVRNESPALYGVTDVNFVSKVILLHSDGTFEVFRAGKQH